MGKNQNRGNASSIHLKAWWPASAAGNAPSFFPDNGERVEALCRVALAARGGEA
jgi:hypothetical protein